MSFLTEDLYDSFEFRNKTFHVNMSFDNILLLMEMFNNDEIDEFEKVDLALEMLIVEFDEIEFESAYQKVGLYKRLIEEFLGYEIGKKANESDDSEEEKVKEYDYEKDAELIYASFFSAYKIDLFEMKGKLHWKKFVVLMNHLDEETAFKKVVKIRTMKIPKANEHNKEDIANLRKAKEFYSLDKRTTDERMNDAFTVVAHAFKGVKAGE